MCIIVDANVLGGFLGEPPDSDAEPIHRWLNQGQGQLIYSTGGKFSDELKGRPKRDKLTQYVRAGRAQLVEYGSAIRERERRLRQEDISSGDPHVLALALEAGVRLLYTADKKLMDDFRDPKLVNRPRGKVYSGAGNKKLLTRTACRSPQ